MHSDFVLYLMLLGVLVRGHPVGPRPRVRNESNRLAKDRRGVTFKHFRGAPFSAVTAELSRSSRNHLRFQCLIGPYKQRPVLRQSRFRDNGREPFPKPKAANQARSSQISRYFFVLSDIFKLLRLAAAHEKRLFQVWHMGSPLPSHS